MFFQSGQCPVQRAVPGEQACATLVANVLGDSETVECFGSSGAKVSSGDEYVPFERDELTWFPSHGSRIRRYMRIVNSVRL